MSNFEAGGAGRAIFVLLLVLVGTLDFMVAGSKWLVGAIRGDEIEAWRSSVILLSFIGTAYFALARGVWAFRNWVTLLNVLLTLLVLGFAVLRFSEDRVLDLSLALVFLLTLPTNLGLLAWSQLPDVRQAFERHGVDSRG